MENAQYNPDYPPLGGSAMGGIGKTMRADEPPRTFNSLAEAVDRLKSTRRQLERMGERISPQPREETAKNEISGSIGPRPYAADLEELHRELDRLGRAVSELEQHV